jgi:hypothetical protein
MDTSNVSNWSGAFNNCTALKTIPAFDFSNATNLAAPFSYAGIESFDGTLETNKVTNFTSTFFRCEQLITVPEVDTSNGTNFQEMFHFCRLITAIPSSMDFSKATNFNETFAECDNFSDFPPNMFDVTGVLNPSAFSRAFSSCALTATSIENILVSLDTNGQTGIFLSINGGANAKKSTWTTAAITAYDNLIIKGWTVQYNN